MTLKGAKVYSEERELQLACVRAYNDWITAFAAPARGRLASQAIIPTTGLDDAVGELDYALKNGVRGSPASR